METKYGIITAKRPEFEPRDLLVVPHKDGELIVSHPAFGSNCFANNVLEMEEEWSHPRTWKEISFRKPTTSESISAIAYNFGNLGKSEILFPRQLQLGYIVRTSEGVFANPPKDSQGNPIVDEIVLRRFLMSGRMINRIYLLDNDFGFAPYETFKQGVQDSGDFSEGGLARVLEHTGSKRAEKLRKISSQKFYKNGVNVSCFHKFEKPILTAPSLGSSRNGHKLEVYGGNSFMNVLEIRSNYLEENDHLAFGVLK